MRHTYVYEKKPQNPLYQNRGTHTPGFKRYTCTASPFYFNNTSTVPRQEQDATLLYTGTLNLSIHIDRNQVKHRRTFLRQHIGYHTPGVYRQALHLWQEVR